MSSVAFVTSNQVLAINELDYGTCPQSAQIPCEDTITQGLAWAVPVTQNGVLYGYEISTVVDKPQSDAVHVVRIWNRTLKITWFAAIGDNDTEAAFVDKCNACCGATPVMTTVTIPNPLVQECPCADEDGNYVYKIPMPSNPNSLALIIAGKFNGVDGVPAPAATYADAAALLTFLNTAVTGWDAYGTWTYEGAGNATLVLTSTTVLCAQIEVTLETASYCFEIPGTPTLVDGIDMDNDGDTVNTSFPQISFDDTTAASRQAIVDALTPYLIGDLEVVLDAGSYFLKYTGVQKPLNLTIGGVLVAATAFSTGACP